MSLYDDDKKTLYQNARIITNRRGDNIVELKTIEFHGKRNVNWDNVREYVSRYVGRQYVVYETNE